MMENLEGRLVQVGLVGNLLERQLLVAGVIGRALEPKGIMPIVVGGCAAEFYTLGSYASYDLDLVAPGHQAIGEVLEGLGFEKQGRHWYHPDADVAVEVPDSVLAGDPERVTTVEIEDFVVRLIGVEDLILDRLRAAVHWKSSLDEEVVRNLMVAQGDEIDWEYLECKADEETPLAEALARLRGQIL